MYIILDIYDITFPMIVTNELGNPIIFNSYNAAEDYSIIIQKSQIVELNQ